MRSLYLLPLLIAISVISVTASVQHNKKQAPPRVIRVSSEDLMRAAVHIVKVVYPPLAAAARVSGPVVVELTVDEQGNVIQTTVLSGHPLLRGSAVAAAREWRFRSIKLSGVPVKAIGAVTFSFNWDAPSPWVIQTEKPIEVPTTELNPQFIWQAHALMLPLSIKLSSERTTVKAGSAIWVNAVTTNDSDHRLRIGFLPGPYEAEDFSVTVQVRNSEDRPVGPERLDQHPCDGIPNCRVEFHESRILGPGESAMDYFLIDKKYDLSRPGTYTVQVVRRDKATDLSYLETAKSNILTFTVTQ